MRPGRGGHGSGNVDPRQPRRSPPSRAAGSRMGLSPIRTAPIGTLNEEDPLPAEGARQQAAEQGAGRGAAAGDAAPDAQGEIAFAALGEGRDEDRQGRRRQQRPAEALDAAEGDQRGLRPGETAGQRGAREEHETGHEHAPAAEHVGQAAAEQQEAAEEDRVGAEHPLQTLDGEVQIGPDRRQRHVHDGDVQHDHELGHADRREDVPLAVHPVASPAARVACGGLSAPGPRVAARSPGDDGIGRGSAIDSLPRTGRTARHRLARRAVRRVFALCKNGGATHSWKSGSPSSGLVTPSFRAAFPRLRAANPSECPPLERRSGCLDGLRELGFPTPARLLELAVTQRPELARDDEAPRLAHGAVTRLLRALPQSR